MAVESLGVFHDVVGIFEGKLGVKLKTLTAVVAPDHKIVGVHHREGAVVSGQYPIRISAPVAVFVVKLVQKLLVNAPGSLQAKIIRNFGK